MVMFKVWVLAGGCLMSSWTLTSSVFSLGIFYIYFVEGSCVLAVFQPMTWRTANSCTSGDILLSFASLNFCSLSKIPGSRSR